MAVKQPSFTRSKWNMGEIYGLKIFSIICTYNTKKIIETPPCALKVLFITEFAISCKRPHFYEVKLIRRKWLAHGGISKIFFLDHFSPSFLGQKW
jgi:hypothetical protein